MVFVKKSKQKLSRSDVVFYLINTTILALFSLIVLYPLLYVLSSSFSSPSAVSMGRVRLFPVEFSLEGYRAVFSYSPLWRSYGMSVLYTVLGTFISVLLTLLAGYPLSRKDFYGGRPLCFLFVFTMFVNAGMVPNYLLVKDLHMLDTVWAIIIPGALSAFNVMIARTFFSSSIPAELLEAAKIDGCDDFSFLWRIVLPLSKSIIAVLALFYAVGIWNSYFNALLYISDRKLFPLQMVLRDILITGNVDAPMQNMESLAEANKLKNVLKYSTIVVSSVPLLVVYPFVQKYFVKGVMIGSIKG